MSLADRENEQLKALIDAGRPLAAENATDGEQEGAAYNRHFGCTCYHPLFVFNQLAPPYNGHLPEAVSRLGHAAS